MAKKTKWGNKWRAARGLTIRAQTPRPIVIRQPTPIRSKGKRRHHHGGGSGSGLSGIFSRHRTQLMVGAFAVGVLEKQGIMQQLPALPFLGRTGTIGVAAHMLSGGKGGIADDIATAAFIIAAHELGSTGTIVGGAGDDPGDSHIGYVAGW